MQILCTIFIEISFHLLPFALTLQPGFLNAFCRSWQKKGKAVKKTPTSINKQRPAAPTSAADRSALLERSLKEEKMFKSKTKCLTSMTKSSASLSSSSPKPPVSMDGLLKYDDLVALLSCGLCGKFCGDNLLQCRKGHVICRSCKNSSKITSCKTCKQTFVDAPNVVLDKMINMIALPCRFRESGCSDYLFADKKIEHETFCPSRPIACQYSSEGCEQVLPYKELTNHHHKCQYNPRSRILKK